MEYPCQQASLAGAKMHSGESFFGCDDALEAVLFSVLIEMIKRQENQVARRKYLTMSTRRMV